MLYLLDVLPACMYHMYAWSHWRLEDGIRFIGTGVGYEPHVAA